MSTDLVARAADLLRWGRGSRRSLSPPSFKPRDLEWFSIAMTPSQWRKLKAMPEMIETEYDSSLLVRGITC